MAGKIKPLIVLLYLALGYVSLRKQQPIDFPQPTLVH